MWKTPDHRCLDRLSRSDFEFIVNVLCPQSDGNERESLYLLLGDPETLRELLEHDAVFRAVIEEAMPLRISPQLYFYVLVRRAMRTASIDEVAVAEYVASILARYAYGKHGGGEGAAQWLDYHIDFLREMDRATAYERYFLQVRCGNRFLFLTGLFPKFLDARRDRRGAPGIEYYEEVARQAFQRASGHPLAEEFDLSGVYDTLSEVLPSTRQALNHMAEHHLFLD